MSVEGEPVLCSCIPWRRLVTSRAQHLRPYRRQDDTPDLIDGLIVVVLQRHVAAFYAVGYYRDAHRETGTVWRGTQTAAT